MRNCHVHVLRTRVIVLAMAHRVQADLFGGNMNLSSQAAITRSLFVLALTCAQGCWLPWEHGFPHDGGDGDEDGDGDGDGRGDAWP